MRNMEAYYSNILEVAYIEVAYTTFWVYHSAMLHSTAPVINAVQNNEKHV